MAINLVSEEFGMPKLRREDRVPKCILSTKLRGHLRRIAPGVHWKINMDELRIYSATLHYNLYPKAIRVLKFVRIAEEINVIMRRPESGKILLTLDIIKEAVAVIDERYKYDFTLNSWKTFIYNNYKI
jgi:hypothetical protein